MNTIIFPAGFNAEAVPAVVQYHETEQTALVLHPMGPTHPNARALAARLRKQGYTVMLYPLEVAA